MLSPPWVWSRAWGDHSLGPEVAFLFQTEWGVEKYFRSAVGISLCVLVRVSPHLGGDCWKWWLQLQQRWVVYELVKCSFLEKEGQVSPTSSWQWARQVSTVHSVLGCCWLCRRRRYLEQEQPEFQSCSAPEALRLSFLLYKRARLPWVCGCAGGVIKWRLLLHCARYYSDHFRKVTLFSLYNNPQSRYPDYHSCLETEKLKRKESKLLLKATRPGSSRVRIQTQQMWLWRWRS